MICLQPLRERRIFVLHFPHHAETFGVEEYWPLAVLVVLVAAIFCMSRYAENRKAERKDNAQASSPNAVISPDGNGQGTQNYKTNPINTQAGSTLRMAGGSYRLGAVLDPYGDHFGSRLRLAPPRTLRKSGLLQLLLKFN